MANVQRGETELIFRGRKLVLRPTMTLLAEFENTYGALWQVAEKISAGSLAVTVLIDMMAFLVSGNDKAPSREDIFEDVIENGIAVYVSALVAFLGSVLSSRIENLPRTTGGEPGEAVARNAQA